MKNICKFDCCKRKLKITDFTCKYCDLKYCINHRLPEEHNCNIDFAKLKENEDKDKIINNMKCVASKIDNI